MTDQTLKSAQTDQVFIPSHSTKRISADIEHAKHMAEFAARFPEHAAPKPSDVATHDSSSASVDAVPAIYIGEAEGGGYPQGDGVPGNSDKPTPNFYKISESQPICSPNSTPKTFRDNLEWRWNMRVNAEKSAEVQAYIKEKCRRDILFWINTFVSTYNPRKVPPTIPLITWEYEDKLILKMVDCLTKQKDLLIEKSRDMGVSWCLLLVYTWFWQFGGEGKDFLVGSRKEQYIDVMGNMDTLLEKVRFIIRNQPAWLIPKGFDWKQHSNYMKIINPETKSTITGEATNNNFSRGGRRFGIGMDEFAFWECDQAAWRASADSSNCRFVISTPCGFNNQFAKLRHSNSIEVMTLHWKLHPEKDEAWYQNECARRNHDSVEIAQELDINYEGSEEGILFEFADLKRAVTNEPVLSPDRIVVSLDPAGEGDDEAVFYVCNNGQIVARKFIAKSTDMELAAEALALITRYKAQVFIADAIGNGVISVVTMLLGKNERQVKVIAFKSSEKAREPIKYYNRRDEVYHLAAQAMKSGNAQVDDDYTLMKQLNATRYKQDNGRIYIASKEEIKDKVGSSPDRADSWVLAIEGLRYTHSAKEVRQAETFRHNFEMAEVISGQEYGDWGDSL